MALSKDIIQFANGETVFYESAEDNFFNPSPEKDATLNRAFFTEVERQSGVARANLAENAWIANPQVRWAALAIVDATITMLLPKTYTNAFQIVTDIRTAGAGDIVKFRIRPNSFMTVSKGGRGERTTFRQKVYDGDLALSTEEHIITVYADMYSVLAGKENIGDFIRMAVMSVMNDMYAEALAVMSAGLASLPVGPYNYTGAFDMKVLVNMAEDIQVRNAGVRPVIMGSTAALMNVLPDSTLGYKFNTSAEAPRIDLTKNVYGYDVVRLDQAANAAGGLVLPSNQIYVLSPSQDKLVKGVVANTMTNANQFYENADLTSNYTQRANYAFAFATATKSGIYTVTD